MDRVLLSLSVLGAAFAASPTHKHRHHRDPHNNLEDQPAAKEPFMFMAVHAVMGQWTMVAVVLVVLLLIGAAAFVYMQKKRKQAEDAEADADAEAGMESPLKEPLVTKEGEAVDIAADAEHNEAPHDYEKVVRQMMDKAQSKFGPKFEADGEVATILQDKATSFGEKAKALVMNEFNETAGSVSKALEAEDVTALLEWDSAIAANFPPLSILLAGLLVPVNLAINYMCHLSQVVLVLVPILCVIAYSEYADWGHPCQSIPGLRLWARIVGATALAVAHSRLVMMKRIGSAQADLQRTSAEMRARLAKAEANSGQVSAGDLRQLFVCHSTTLQYAVVCESRCNASFFAHVIGVGTLIWLFSTFFNMFLYFKYMFVPGVVAFHPSAADDPSYCAAWVTVCASKVAVVIAVLFFFMNLGTVFLWATQSALDSDGMVSKISSQARSFDSSNLGIPAAQLLVRAFLFRAQADVLIAKFAVSMREKSELAKEYADTESRLMALKARVAKKESEVSKMQEEMDNQGGGTIEASVQRMTEKGLDFATMQTKGAAMIDSAKMKAAELEVAATDEIEKLVERVQELMKQVTDSDSFKAAQAKAQQAAEEAEAAAEKAAQQAQEMAEQAKASADDAVQKLQDPELMEQVQAMAAKAQEQGQAMAAQAQTAAQDLK